MAGKIESFVDFARDLNSPNQPPYDSFDVTGFEAFVLLSMSVFSLHTAWVLSDSSLSLLVRDGFNMVGARVPTCALPEEQKVRRGVVKGILLYVFCYRINLNC